jgi:exopolysaccharide production protein ExoQ
VSLVTRRFVYLPHGVSKAVVAAGMMVTFVAVLVVCMKLSSESPWVILIPSLCVVGIAAAAVVIAASAGSVPAIIIAFVVLLFLSNANFRVRSELDTGLDWQGLLKFAVWFASSLIGLPYFLRSGSPFRSPAALLWICYISIATLSLFGAPSPVFSFGYLISMFSLYIFTYALVDRLTEAKILWTITLTLTSFLIISWIVVYAYPELGEFRDVADNGFVMRMNGIGGQANNLGLVCATYIGAIFLLGWRRHARWLTLLPMAALAIATLRATDSRTAIIGACVGIVAVVLIRSKWALAMLGLLAALLLVGAGSVPMRYGMLMDDFSRSGDSSEVITLTGRTQIWDFTWEKILERPLFGWGYNSSKEVLGQHIGFANGLIVDTTHNLLLQNLLSVGFIGTLSLIGLFLIFVNNIIRNRLSDFAALNLAIVYVTGVSDSSALGTTPTVLAMMFMLASLWPLKASTLPLDRRTMLLPDRGRSSSKRTNDKYPVLN